MNDPILSGLGDLRQRVKADYAQAVCRSALRGQIVGYLGDSSFIGRGCALRCGRYLSSNQWLTLCSRPPIFPATPLGRAWEAAECRKQNGAASQGT